jgi:DNA helicase II / ATP-dependent DNA helicase PcrA
LYYSLYFKSQNKIRSDFQFSIPGVGVGCYVFKKIKELFYEPKLSFIRVIFVDIITFVAIAKQKIKLNKEQKAAVEHADGPLLIIAGAGTGKTTVITERIKHLISSGLAKTDEILALTFTDKAAREMEARVDRAMPYGYTQMWISTFHSFCDQILRKEALSIGLDTNFRLMTQAQSVQFVRDNIFEFELNYFRPLGNPTKFVDAMLQHFSRLQDEDVTPDEYLSWVNSKLKNKKSKRSGDEKLEMEKWLELANSYKKYDELKIKEGKMDFGDVIVKTLKLFRDRPNVLKKYQEQFKHVMVDEFQDTNVSQYQLLKLLAPPVNKANLTAVGDDSQSIYKFRGAAISNILHFKDDYPEALTVVLTKNYRSTQAILDPAYSLIQFNNPDTLESRLGIDKNLVSMKDVDNGEPVRFVHKDRVENEAESAAMKIGELVNGGEYDYGDIAILVRANNHADAFIRAFQRMSIPYQFLGPGKLFQQEEIIDLISYLKVLYNFEDSVSFYRLLALDYFRVYQKDLIRIGNKAKKDRISLFEAAEKIDEIPVSEKTKKKVKMILRIINDNMEKMKQETAGQLLYNFLEETGLLKKLLNPDTAEAEKRAANISKFFDKLKTYETENESASVFSVVDWIELSAELGESPLAANTDWSEVDAVNILTVHSAKGLEFPVVFLVNLVAQRFPSRERSETIPIPEELIKEVLPEGNYHTQEERRLFYVGMTRARDKLFLTAADYYGEAKREKKLSPFIFEALGDEVLSAEQKQGSEQLSFLDYEKRDEEQAPANKMPFHIDYLSYSQINTFKICPVHYKMDYILRIQKPDTAALSFGKSIHTSLKDFYQAAIAGEKVNKDILMKTLDNNWRTTGYHSKAHEDEMYKKGKEALSEFFEKEFDKNNLPKLLEQKFTVPLDLKYAGEDKRRLVIGGVFDRVDDTGDGVEILDYKTGGNVPSQKDVDKDDQLTFYALAATKIPEEPFVDDPKNVKLSLYYFEEQKRISTVRTSDQLVEAQKEIFKYRKEIEESDFKCSGHYFCKTGCEYSMMCNPN